MAIDITELLKEVVERTGWRTSLEVRVDEGYMIQYGYQEFAGLEVITAEFLEIWRGAPIPIPKGATINSADVKFEYFGIGAKDV